MISQQSKFYIALHSVVLIAFFCSGVVFGQAYPVSGLTPELFQSDRPLIITIRTDLMPLIHHPAEETQYQPAEVIYYDKGTADTLTTRIRIRGHFRKDTANCDFPPLRLNFKKRDIRNTLFGPEDKFRIVTHCRTDENIFNQYVVREYLVYRIFNLLVPVSLKVRLAQITYADTGGRLNSFTRFGFFLEDEDQFATRFNMEELTGKVTYNDINEKEGLLLAMFQFMIGNTDWIIPFSKNLILLKNDNEIYAIPYDFDYCGIVNTDYRNAYGFTSLTQPQRVFKGKCYTEKELKAVFRIFNKSRRKIVNLVTTNRQLDEDSRRYMYNYLMSFYRLIHSRDTREKYFRVNCNP